MTGHFLMRGRGGLDRPVGGGAFNAPASACDSCFPAYFPGLGMSTLKAVPSPRCHWS